MIKIQFNKHRINYRIKARDVQVIGVDGRNIGAMPVRNAIKLAEEQGLDLVEIAPNTNPPVCKIMDYGKYKYELQKKAKEAKRHQRVIDVKELKIRPNIEEHDYQVKIRSLQSFLEKGDKVKVTMMFRGRQTVHMDIGYKLMDRIIQDSASLSTIIQKPSLEGRNLILILLGKPKTI
ncbi:MAG: translation initiation factor IF-3 [bacterium]